MFPPKDKAVWVSCGPCGHVWIAMHLPMEATKASRCMKRIFCPACGELKKVFMASAEQVATSQRKHLDEARKLIAEASDA